MQCDLPPVDEAGCYSERRNEPRCEDIERLDLDLDTARKIQGAPVDGVAIYAEQLNKLCCGHPLWDPAIDATGEVQLGDVGFILRGHFQRLFNITVSSDDPTNISSQFGRRLPQEFRPVDIASDVLEDYRQDISGTTLQFLSATSSLDSFGRFVGHAAHLKIGPNATRTQLPTSTKFEDYVADNHRDWFSHLEACGLDYDPSELVCISGFIKGSNLDLRTLVHTPFNGYDCPSDHQSYTSWADTTLNLAGFIEFYRVRYRLPREDLDQISEPEDIDFISGLDTRPVKTPLDDLLEHLLLVCENAEAAMANHEQLYRLFDSRGFPKDLPAFLEQLSPDVRVHNGVAMLDLGPPNTLPLPSAVWNSILPSAPLVDEHRRRQEHKWQLALVEEEMAEGPVM